MMNRPKVTVLFAMLMAVLMMVVPLVGAADAPAGTIIFTSDRTGSWQMYRLLPDGTDEPLLPGTTLTALRPRVSNNGKHVVFEGKETKSTTDVYIMDIGGTNIKRVTDGAVNHFFPVLSPDGTKIAYETDTQLHVISTDGTNRVQLTTDRGRQASWSPDGSKLIYSSNRSGRYQLYMMNADGTEDKQLTGFAGDSRFPSWSTYGDKILFDSNMGGNYDIYVLEFPTMVLTKLTDNPLNDMTPRWSPDGSQIIYTSVREGAKESLYVMNADGSDPRVLVLIEGTKNEYASWGW